MAFSHYLQVMSLDPKLRLRHLNCFMEVARTGSVAAAAEALHVTQPAVSKTLRELEAILGNPLFDRTGRRLKMNAAGATFQKFTGSALGDLARAQAVVRGAQGGEVKLNIGVLPTAATDLLPEAAIAFRARHPNCVLRVSTGPNWLLLSQLREGALDMVVGRMAEPDRMEGLSFAQLYPEEIIAAVRPDHPLRALSVDGLLNHPLILPPTGAVIGAAVRSYLLSIGANAVTPAFETVALAFGRRVVQQTDAIWFISRGVVAEELAAGSLRALVPERPVPAGPVGISLRAETVPVPELAALIETLKAAAGPRARRFEAP